MPKPEPKVNFSSEAWFYYFSVVMVCVGFYQLGYNECKFGTIEMVADFSYGSEAV